MLLGPPTPSRWKTRTRTSVLGALCLDFDMIPVPETGNVTAPVLARWLGISGKEVYELAKAGVIVKVGRDLYALEPSVRGYCEHLRRTLGGVKDRGGGS
jgi:hypothetical protein